MDGTWMGETSCMACTPDDLYPICSSFTSSLSRAQRISQLSRSRAPLGPLSVFPPQINAALVVALCASSRSSPRSSGLSCVANIWPFNSSNGLYIRPDHDYSGHTHIEGCVLCPSLASLGIQTSDTNRTERHDLTFNHTAYRTFAIVCLTPYGGCYPYHPTHDSSLDTSRTPSDILSYHHRSQRFLTSRSRDHRQCHP